MFIKVAIFVLSCTTPRGFYDLDLKPGQWIKSLFQKMRIPTVQVPLTVEDSIFRSDLNLPKEQTLTRQARFLPVRGVQTR
jgi:hypothetical protein